MTNKIKPNLGQDVFIAQINTLAAIEEKRYFIHQYWCNSGHQNQLLELGILFTDKDEAIAKTKSLLGIAERSPKQAEWQNGDECVYKGRQNLKCKFVAIHPGNKQCAIIWEGGGDINLSCVSIDCLSKPETPEQKAECDRLEAAYDLYCEWYQTIWLDIIGISSIEEFIRDERVCKSWLAIVDKTNYRKQ